MKNCIVIIISFFITSCVDHFTIPENINSNNSNIFGAGDTTFLLLSPNWDESYGLESPTEISISPDGRIFVADKNINSIHVLNQDGSVPAGFSGLKSLKNEEGNPLYPIDLDIDNKMNVYFIDGSHLVYVWNQNWNEVGINKVALSAIYRNKETQFDTILDINSNLWSAIINDEATDFLNDWELVENVFLQDDDIINGLLNPHT